MCLITFAWQPETRALQLWANRDEFYARPTAPADLWRDGITWGGRDLQAGGSWLAIQKGARMAALTNIRAPDRITGARSRGDLVAGFMASNLSASEYFQSLKRDEYGRFNLLLLDQTGLYFGASDEPLRPLDAGHYGLSNASLNTPWPKLTSVVDAWSQGQVEQAMLDTQTYPDHQLPDTGVAIEWERRLSSAFIESPDYGTRAVTYVQLDNEKFSASERCFGPLQGVRRIADL